MSLNCILEVRYTLLYLTWITNKDLSYIAQGTLLNLMCKPEWEGVWGRLDKYICIWLRPFAIHLKLPQYRQSALSQNKIKSLKLKKKRLKHATR